MIYLRFVCSLCLVDAMPCCLVASFVPLFADVLVSFPACSLFCLFVVAMLRSRSASTDASNLRTSSRMWHCENLRVRWSCSGFSYAAEKVNKCAALRVLAGFIATSAGEATKATAEAAVAARVTTAASSTTIPTSRARTMATPPGAKRPAQLQLQYMSCCVNHAPSFSNRLFFARVSVPPSS